MKISVLLLRVVHSLFALYFISCIVYIYYSVFSNQRDLVLGVAVASLAIEGFLVFILNGGHCPLAPLQKKLDDPVPFFNLFLPDTLAKQAIPFFSIITFLGLGLLVVQYLLNL